MDYFDIETEAMMKIASHISQPTMALWKQVRHMIMERCAMFESGRMAAPVWVNRKLKELDPLLQLRWDYFERCWVVDRYSRADRAWVQVCLWKDNGVGRKLDNSLFETLREGDTWRFKSSEEYLAWKHRKSQEIRRRNQQKSDDQLLEAIDNMSTRQIENFQEVERALAVGDTVVLGGESEKTMERMHEAALQQAAKGTPPIPNDIPVHKPQAWMKSKTEG